MSHCGARPQHAFFSTRAEKVFFCNQKCPKRPKSCKPKWSSGAAGAGKIQGNYVLAPEQCHIRIPQLCTTSPSAATFSPSTTTTLPSMASIVTSLNNWAFAYGSGPTLRRVFWPRNGQVVRRRRLAKSKLRKLGWLSGLVRHTKTIRLVPGHRQFLAKLGQPAGGLALGQVAHTKKTMHKKNAQEPAKTDLPEEWAARTGQCRGRTVSFRRVFPAVSFPPCRFRRFPPCLFRCFPRRVFFAVFPPCLSRHVFPTVYFPPCLFRRGVRRPSREGGVHCVWCIPFVAGLGRWTSWALGQLGAEPVGSWASWALGQLFPKQVIVLRPAQRPPHQSVACHVSGTLPLSFAQLDDHAAQGGAVKTTISGGSTGFSVATVQFGALLTSNGLHNHFFGGSSHLQHLPGSNSTVRVRSAKATAQPSKATTPPSKVTTPPSMGTTLPSTATAVPSTAPITDTPLAAGETHVPSRAPQTALPSTATTAPSMTTTTPSKTSAHPSAATILPSTAPSLKSLGSRCGAPGAGVWLAHLEQISTILEHCNVGNTYKRGELWGTGLAECLPGLARGRSIWDAEPRRKLFRRCVKQTDIPAPGENEWPMDCTHIYVEKHGRNGCGRVPDASHTIEFEETDASRTRPQPFLPECHPGLPCGEGYGVLMPAKWRLPTLRTGHRLVWPGDPFPHFLIILMSGTVGAIVGQAEAATERV
eukprot:gene8819-biopygen123